MDSTSPAAGGEGPPPVPTEAEIDRLIRQLDQVLSLRGCVFSDGETFGDDVDRLQKRLAKLARSRGGSRRVLPDATQSAGPAKGPPAPSPAVAVAPPAAVRPTEPPRVSAPPPAPARAEQTRAEVQSEPAIPAQGPPAQPRAVLPDRNVQDHEELLQPSEAQAKSPAAPDALPSASPEAAAIRLNPLFSPPRTHAPAASPQQPQAPVTAGSPRQPDAGLVAPPTVAPVPPPAPQPAPRKPAIRLQLKPGTVGQPYSLTLAVPDRPGAHGFRLPEAEALSRLGLRLDGEGGVLTGTPTEAGEHAFALQAEITDGRGEPAAVDLDCRLLVNPDPRSLWKTLEPEPDQPYRKPHTDTLRVDTGDFLILGASKRGRSHAHEAKFREDDMAAAVLPNGWHIGVVCDGAGSARLSRLGSKTAATVCRDTLKASLSQLDDAEIEAIAAGMVADRTDAELNSRLGVMLYEQLVVAAHTAAKAVEAQAAEAGAKPRDLASTLLITILRRTGAGVFVAGFSIGDGAAGLLRLAPLYHKPLTHPDSGEYAGQTRFLALSEFGADVNTRLRADVQPDLDAVLMMTDGVSDPRLPTDAALADPERWRALWEELTAAGDLTRANPDAEQVLLYWLDFWSPGNHDDRTILLMRP